MSEQPPAFDERTGSNRLRMKEDLLRWMNIFYKRQTMLRKPDNENQPQNSVFFLLPLFNPTLASVPHTQQPRLALTHFFSPDCDGTLQLFRVEGQKVSGWGRQTIFFCECVRLKKVKGGWLVVKRDSRCQGICVYWEFWVLVNEWRGHENGSKHKQQSHTQLPLTSTNHSSQHTALAVFGFWRKAFLYFQT